MVGAGGQTPVSPRSLTIFSRIKKEVDPGIITIAGGPHFTFTDLESLEQCPELDAVVRGEGEATVSHLAVRYRQRRIARRGERYYLAKRAGPYCAQS